MPLRFVSRARTVLILAGIALAMAPIAQGQGVDYLKAHYIKHEYRIPMRDGVHLFTAVYVPKDESKPHPILLQRTCYGVGPYGESEFDEELGPSPLFAKAEYIVAYQDVRGTFLSDGKFVDMRPQLSDQAGPKDFDESTDAFDTIEWLVKNVPGNNGKVGVWGISYPGFFAAAATINAHPALKAVSPQAPMIDWFLGDDVHHNGAFFLQQEFNFDAVLGVERPKPTKTPYTAFDHKTNNAYQFFLNMGPLPRADSVYFKGTRPFWTQVMDHGTYDEYWKSRSLLPRLKDVQPAVMTVGGWFDAEDLFGPLHAYPAIEANRPRSENFLVMGPWVHGGWSGGKGDMLGPIQFDSKTAEFYRQTIEFPFFEHHLNNSPDEWKPPEAWAFETGRNRWHQFSAWPPPEARPKSFYLGGGGSIGSEPPKATDPAFDSYESDPARPVPYTSRIGISPPSTFPVEDQRFASKRADVLTYQTEPLAENLTIAGPILADLFVSTTGTDSDWVVKVIDVYPESYPDPVPNPSRAKMAGYQQLVRADVIRGKFRNSLEKPEPFQPGEPTRVAFPLQDAFHTFRPGHRLMIQVQSSWFPMVDRNPQTFTDIYHAQESDFQKATQRVHHSPGRASRIEVKVVP